MHKWPSAWQQQCDPTQDYEEFNSGGTSDYTKTENNPNISSAHSCKIKNHKRKTKRNAQKHFFIEL